MRAPLALTPAGFVALLAAACAPATPVAEVPPRRASPPLVAPPALEAPVRACLWLLACDEAAASDGSFLSRCVDEAASRGADGETECLSRARSCSDVLACVGREATDAARRLCDARPGGIVFCDDNRLVSCDGERPRMTSCGELRGTCREQRIASGIVVRGCASPHLCGDAAATRRCDGISKLVSCQDGIAELARCPRGTRCTEAMSAPGEQGASCVPIGTRPCAPGRARCVGDVRVSCLSVQGRHVVGETDCAAAQMSCLDVLGDGASCAAGDACAGGPATCDGAALRFCASGLPVRADCRRYGLGACRPGKAGAFATCGPPL